jgi:diguanylate cyclase (GGDEF)-like protein
MSLNFNALPALIALAILVVVFAAISRQHTRERVGLWLSGWILVLLRAAVQFANPAGRHGFQFEVAIGVSALELASIAFIVSVAPNATTAARQLLLTVILAVPALTYTIALVSGVTSTTFYFACIGIGCAAALLLLWRWQRTTLSLYVICMSLGLLVSAALMAWSVHHGKLEQAVEILLTAMNFFAAGLFWYSLRRNSAGVLATVFGFFSWGASFPLSLLLQAHPATRLDVEIWDIPKYLVAIGMIVTLLEEQIIESEHLAYHDALTGLPNRRLLQDRLLQAIAHAGRTGKKIAVLLLDLDDFKAVNDTFGHRIGDGVLQETAARLLARLRAADTIARTGGDEFTVISEVAGPQGAQTLVWALEAALILPLRVERRTVRLSVSVGYALYPDDATDPGEVCALADRAMYAAKNSNRALRASSDAPPVG